VQLVIGIDFDNTIACYDHVFCNVARKLGMLGDGGLLSKIQVKQLLLNQKDGDLIWQKLQGKVYGEYMELASLFPGVVEFLHLSRLKGHRVVVVSHKSEYGHFDEEKIPLRDAAMNWMQNIGIVDANTSLLNKKDVYFASTRELKVKKIQELQCDYFIDDLVEVFNEQTFPQTIKKILFEPGQKHLASDNINVARSWRQIQKTILDDWNELDVVVVAQNIFPTLNVKMASLVKGRGNSRIYKLTSINDTNYALKIYPDRQLDSRQRLETEYTSCQYLFESGFPVMKACVNNKNLNWAVYEWISGHSIESVDDEFIENAVSFIESLYKESRGCHDKGKFVEASEACLSGQTIVQQINKRLEHLKETDSLELSDFLQKEFVPKFEMLTNQAREKVADFFDTRLTRELQIMSPSDFGSHNAVKENSGQIMFIDFEYFGWDDPVKLISDFYWHPGMNLSQEFKTKWINSVRDIFKSDVSYELRLSAYLPLYALRWCLIMLNEFLPDRLINRLNANHQNEKNVKQMLEDQLSKSRKLLNQVTEDIPYYGPTLQTS
jgi:thiamine kinase-like enzyme